MRQAHRHKQTRFRLPQHRRLLLLLIEIPFRIDEDRSGPVSESHRLLTDRGCVFIKQPGQVSGESWAATFKDPDGHLLTIFGGK